MAVEFWKTRDASILPVLADALEEDGLHDPWGILTSFRGGESVGLSHGVIYQIVTSQEKS